MDKIVEIILNVWPGLKGAIDYVDIHLTAIPAWGQVALPVIIIFIGGYLFLSYNGNVPGPFGRSEDDD